MNKWMIIVIAVAGYLYWKQHHVPQLEPLHSQAYVEVFGRKSCGYTNSALKTMKENGVNYIFRNVDDDPTAEFLHGRMEEAGISTGRYNLPVIDVNGKVVVRPENDWVLGEYQAGIN